MKKFGLYLVVSMLLASCNGIKTVRADMEGECPECGTESAKAILWVDWKYGEALDDYKLVRTAKARSMCLLLPCIPPFLPEVIKLSTSFQDRRSFAGRRIVLSR